MASPHARLMAGAFAGNFGSGALRVEQRPELRDRLVAFANGKPSSY